MSPKASPANRHRKELDMETNKDTTKGPDYIRKEPTPYLYDAPTDAPHPGKHQSGVGGPSDRNKDGVDDSTQ